MDPNFGLLLGDKPTKCNNKSSSKTTLIIAIVVPLVVALIITTAFLVYYFRPKIQTWRKVKQAKKSSGNNSGNSGNREREREISIEKAPDMELHTVAGEFKVRM